MYKLTFANGVEIEVIDGVVSTRDSSAGESRDAFQFLVRVSDIGFEELNDLVGDPEATTEVYLTNTEYETIDEETGDPILVPISEVYYGYVDMVSIRYQRRVIQSGLLNVPVVFEWVYEVLLAERTNIQIKLMAVKDLLEHISDEDASLFMYAFPVWSSMGQYDGFRYTGRFEVGYRCRDNEFVYKCIQEHDIDPMELHRNPANEPELWVCIATPSDEWPPWVQKPNGYEFMAKVCDVGKRFISVYHGENVWPPREAERHVWEEVI